MMLVVSSTAELLHMRQQPIIINHSVNYLIMALIVAMSHSLAARADSYTDGCKSYGSGDLRHAREQFEAAAAANPTSWQVQYQLGNTYVRLNDKERAKQAYDKALGLSPPEAYKTHISKAMSYLGGTGSGSTSEANSTRTSTSGEQAFSHGSSGLATDPMQAKIEERRKHILSDAKEAANRVRQQRKQQRDELEANGNQRYRTADGNVRMGLGGDQERDFDAETERMVSRIIQDGKIKAEAVNSP
jgi:tetratricopeptide (TPR) repeat protein